MTAPARITQADMERATKAVKAAGIERARIVMDLSNGRIEVILGAPESVSVETKDDGWDDDE
ncbi:hypothetical protein GG804_25945 [Sphingomonas histidinilytica]|uniref:hypothetical protein n=1 Tax=Rhizorhabdus histidinilytica TaxID=439228 RepID=UPI001ADC3A69|nr:hypothetical protein [Rhizorhabdus histidinilytica]MBO9380213.1 hypothetical protein [Rhizorhabdus histidinilytica]